MCEQINKKTGKTKRNNVFKTLTAAFLIGVVLLGVFMSSDVGADVFGFDASVLGELNVYNEIYRQPNRKKCALLPFESLKKIIDKM